MARIAVGGFQHETNTFAPSRATFATFEPIAREVLVVVAPGPAKADPTGFAWMRLREGMRLVPLGPAFHRPKGATS